MARSYKHAPYTVYCGGSQQAYKRIGNRKIRCYVRVSLLHEDPDAAVYPVVDETMNRYWMPDDGTRHYDDACARYVRARGNNRRDMPVAEKMWIRSAMSK